MGIWSWRCTSTSYVGIWSSVASLAGFRAAWVSSPSAWVSGPHERVRAERIGVGVWSAIVGIWSFS